VVLSSNGFGVACMISRAGKEIFDGELYTSATCDEGNDNAMRAC
jgi:hypothetical protein